MPEDRQLQAFFTAWVEDFGRQMQRAMVTLGEAIAEMLPVLRGWHEASLPYRRAVYGGDARWAYSEDWHSPMCGAWLHENCPSDEHDLQCACSCHRRKR